jgi:hypothetical protein
MKRGSGGITPTFLTSALELHASDVLNPRERVSGSHWIGVWVGPRVGLDAVENRIIFHCRVSNSGFPAHIPFLYRLSYPDCYPLLYF